MYIQDYGMSSSSEKGKLCEIDTVRVPEVGRVLRLSKSSFRICTTDIDINVSFESFLKIVLNVSID